MVIRGTFGNAMMLAAPTPHFDRSPRFDLRTAEQSRITAAIAETGHCVLDGAWNIAYLDSLLTKSKRYFDEMDERYRRDPDALSFGERAQYHGHFAGTHYVTSERDFQFELERSGLTAILRGLLNGDFVSAESERVIRRAIPSSSLSYVGLHRDFQLDKLAARSRNRTRGVLTVWSPLCDCTGERISRLLLLQAGFNPLDVLSDEDFVEVEGRRFPVIALRPVSVLNEAEYPDLTGRVRTALRKLYATGQAFSPPVSVGSCVIFHSEVWHGSYIPETWSEPRINIDFRVVGDYRVSRDNWRYRGTLFRSRPKPSRVIVYTFEELPSILRTKILVVWPQRLRRLVRRMLVEWPRRIRDGIARRLRKLIDRAG